MNYKLLDKKIKETENEITDISRKIGISERQLKLKLSGKCGFKLSEANTLGDILNLSKIEKSDIFFGSEDDD